MNMPGSMVFRPDMKESEVIPEHPLKRLLPRLTDVGRVILFRLVHPSKTLLAIVLTVDGMLMAESAVQFWKAYSRIVSTFGPIFTCVRLLQSLNARSPMATTL